ncbi:hypothetical protein B566_EDAN003024 [Ephemera danica]|nr:hypothetical protein B566_EDAN003024 [Ephemera danica]
MSRLFELVAVAVLVSAACAQGPMLDIPGLGTVMGDTDISYVNDRVYYRYRGMPFATQPVGPQYRYKAPDPVQPWEGVYNATQIGNRCPQTTVDFGNKTNPFDWTRVSETEDCLVLSVYTPTTDGAANLPVLVFWHGGAFESGSGIIYDGKKFMDYDVILVVPHYRLGPIGFLSLDTDDIPGNAGMLDQVEALKWVKNHIRVFGGNPNQITIMGESAGAASVSLHNISPLSNGMFQQFIPQSGAATAIWATDPDHLYAATELGKLINCPALDIPTLTQCYLEVDVMVLLKAYNVFQANEVAAGRSPFAGSSPVVQTAGAKRFIVEDPRVTLEKGDYVYHPALLGANKHEGTLVYSILYDGFFMANNLTEDAEFMQRDATNMLVDFFRVQDQGESIAAMIEKAHFGQENMGNFTAMTPGMVDFLSNMFLKGPVYEDALYNYNRAPTYLYAFHYYGDRSLWTFIGNPNAITGGVNHAQELILQFDLPAFILSARDRAMSKTLLDLWVNFITYGDPTPAANPVPEVGIWPMFDGSTRAGQYLRINDTCYAIAVLAAVLLLSHVSAQNPEVTIPGLGTNDSSANLPVLVFWHGGAFVAGSGVIYDGKKFMDYDVILVVPHYRLGPLGFLSLDTDDIPGNAGMLDQVEALKWVKNHISVFGGNPNQITIMGESAGAASVSLHNQFIPQSGAATAIWSIDINPVYAATEIGKLINCPALDIPTLTTCFLEVEVMVLLRAYSQFQANEIAAGRTPFAGSSPVVQKAGTKRFILEDPRQTLEKGDYVYHPALLGANKHEGTLVYSMLYGGFVTYHNLTEDSTFFQRECTNMLIEFFRIQDQGESIAAMIEKAHFGQENMGNGTAMTPGTVDFMSNMFLKGPIYDDALYNYKRAPTYLYAFHYFGDRSLWNFIGNPDAIIGGVNHAQELILQFDLPAFILSARDRAMSKTLLDLWVNFITYGDPTPAANPVPEVGIWPMFDGSTRAGQYLRINDTCYASSDYTFNEYFVAGDEGFPFLTDH